MLGKIFSLIAIAILVVTVIILVHGCGGKIKIEKIIGKSFNKAYVETILLPVQQGELSVAEFVRHTDKWSLGTFSKDRPRMERYKWFDVSKEVFDSYKVGDIVNYLGG